VRTAIRVLHALGHALVISGSLTWEIRRALILCFVQRPSFAGRGAPGHHDPAARRRPAQDGYGCLTLAYNAAPAFEIPYRCLLLVISPVNAVRTFWAWWLLRSPVR
jgi:hypothetical protein